MFGAIEPYGIVWRTGANAATKIKLTDSITIEGHPLAPGEYALFTIPQANEWTSHYQSNRATVGRLFL